MFATKLRCLRCGKEYPLLLKYNCSKCKGILDVEYDYEAMEKQEIGSRLSIRKGQGMWRFRDFLPIRNEENIVTLIEGDTPLFSCERLGAAMNLSNLYLKDETRNPTGCFKDRPISCAISKAKEEGKNAVITSSFLNPFATEGDKTVAYELYQQLGLVPGWIVVPVGAGPLLAGIYKGYKELKQLGLVDRLPAMVAVQARGCAPIVRAFDKGDPEVEPWEVPHTVASGIADPLQGYSEDGTLTLR